MCDVICAITDAGTFFAKNSDRPVGEPQVLQSLPARHPGDDPAEPTPARLRTQYIEIEDAGAVPCLLSRPVWLWGAEHGVNDYHVAIGNEKIYTLDDPYEAPPALIGMDLVRLGLERSSTARQALATITALIEAHGQGGVGDAHANEPYWSSFLIADPSEAYVLETSAGNWVARRVARGGDAAISNRVTIRSDWAMASAAFSPGEDFDRRRSPEAPTAHADVRLAASRSFLDSLAAHPLPGTRGAFPQRHPEATVDGVTAFAGLFASHLRDHGTGPWGNPLDPAALPVAPPTFSLPDGTGVSVCMHIRSYQATTSSMVAFLPSEHGRRARGWTALGSPCVSIFVPVLVPDALPALLAEEATWQRFDLLRQSVEDDPCSIGRIRAALAPLEHSLWLEAACLDDSGAAWQAFHSSATTAIDDVLASLGV